MSSEIIRRSNHGSYYANVSYMGVRLRDCLKTVNRNEAQRRLIELKLLVERGDYQKIKQTFDELVADYEPVSRRGIYKGKPNKEKKDFAQNYLMSIFKGKKVVDIDVDAWAKAHALDPRWSGSSCKKHFTVMRELGFDLPAVDYKPGKGWNLDQILEEKDVLKVLNFMPEKYRDVCMISALTSLRLGNVIKMSKKDVQATGWIKPVNGQAKTGLPVEVKISKALAKIFQRLPAPLREDDLYFPHLRNMNKALSTAVRRAFKRAGYSFGSFIHFRHFHACSALDSGHTLEEIQAQLGHKNISQTQVYARVKREKLAKVAESVDTTLTQVGGH